MVTVPGVTAVTMPVVKLIVATAGALLVHEPPPETSLNVAEPHINVLPVMARGAGLR